MYENIYLLPLRRILQYLTSNSHRERTLGPAGHLICFSHEVSIFLLYCEWVEMPVWCCAWLSSAQYVERTRAGLWSPEIVHKTHWSDYHIGIVNPLSKNLIKYWDFRKELHWRWVLESYFINAVEFWKWLHNFEFKHSNKVLNIKGVLV